MDNLITLHTCHIKITIGMLLDNLYANHLGWLLKIWLLADLKKTCLQTNQFLTYAQFESKEFFFWFLNLIRNLICLHSYKDYQWIVWQIIQWAGQLLKSWSSKREIINNFISKKNQIFSPNATLEKFHHSSSIHVSLIHFIFNRTWV